LAGSAYFGQQAYADDGRHRKQSSFGCLASGMQAARQLLEA
jgi:hypothetical protein